MNKNKIEQVILDLYRNNKDIVNDDTILLEKVWYAFGWDDNKSLYDNLSRVPRPESITRRKRELRETWLIEYSQKALDDRTEAFKSEQE